MEEFTLQKIYSRFQEKTGPSVGDDCAVFDDGSLISTDSFVEDVHFKLNQSSAFDITYKAVTAAVSDILAMGGRPKHLLTSAAFPKRIENSWIESSLEGVHEACSAYNLKLIGGDTTRSPSSVFFNVTVMGSMDNGQRAIMQSGAKAKEGIFISGTLGDSLAGRLLLERKELACSSSEKSAKLLQRFRRPSIEFPLALELAKTGMITAMTDCSDGLHSDLKKISSRATVGAEIWTEQLPFSLEFLDFTKTNHFDSIDLAVCGGEDYNLLFTAPADFCWDHSRFKIYKIGTVTDSPGVSYLKKEKTFLPNLEYLFKH